MIIYGVCLRRITIMKRILLLLVFSIAALLLFVGNVSANMHEVSPEFLSYPKCVNMQEAQIAGMKAGQGCRVCVASITKTGLSSNIFVYRSGWTHTATSESDSDLAEDQINVDGFKYIRWVAGGSWQLDDSCDDHRTNTSHAACRTFGSGGVAEKQDGYHYFHKSGYGDTNFSTSDTW